MSSVLKRKDVSDCLSEMHNKFVVVPIEKAANNVAFICKRFYVEVILNEIGIIGVGNETYVRADYDKSKIVQENVNFFEPSRLEKLTFSCTISPLSQSALT